MKKDKCSVTDCKRKVDITGTRFQLCSKHYKDLLNGDLSEIKKYLEK